VEWSYLRVMTRGCGSIVRIECTLFKRWVLVDIDSLGFVIYGGSEIGGSIVCHL